MLPADSRPTAPRASLRPSADNALPPLKAGKLLDQLRERIRMLHYSLRTEQAYAHWCRAFIRFHGLKHPGTMGGPEVEAFLIHLADERGLAPSSHRQALSALLFLYGKVLGHQLPWMREIGRPVPKRRLPLVLGVDEVALVLGHMAGEHQLLARLLYGTGLRISEALGLRVKDIDFAQRAIFVRQGKGGKDRVVMLPASLATGPRELPQDTYFPAPTVQVRQVQEASQADEEIQLDRWAHESFWSSIHAQHPDVAPTSDKDVTVDARFVLFADGSGAFLPADGRVVEVSALFETGANFDITEDKLPRTSVRDLEEGDLVMLRLSGSGDYLDDVADSLIEKAGEAGLRGRALQWKDRLHEVIKRHGEGVVAMKVRGLGVRLRSPQYLWAWAGDAVIAAPPIWLRRPSSPST